MTPDPRRAVAACFIFNGLVTATWISRLPLLRRRLDLTNTTLSWLLLCAAGASLLALPLAGGMVHRWSAATVVRWGMVQCTVGLSGLSIGALIRSPVLVGISLFMIGSAVAVWDVAMNVEASAVERELNRTIMPRFHAGFSSGTMVGAGLGVLASRMDVPMPLHLMPVALAVLAVGWRSTRSFVPADDIGDSEGHGALKAWLEPRTLALGVMVLALAMTEGVANDWLALALKDGYGVAEWVAVLGYATFLSAMTVGRLVGPVFLDRYGRVRVLWGTIALAACGVLAVVFGGSAPVVIAGVLAWGLGASLGFPIGMSAAGDEPSKAAARVSVVATIGYGAFLLGPVTLGFLGDHIGLLRALLVLCFVLLVAAVVAPSAREVSPGTR